MFRVNPVTGRFEEERAKPWEGMSEEQKEYEVMKLVDAMDKLQRFVSSYVVYNYTMQSSLI